MPYSRRFRFNVGDVVVLSAAGLAAFDAETKKLRVRHEWKLGDRFTILKKYPSRTGSDEYMVRYPQGDRGRYSARLIDERWEKVGNDSPTARTPSAPPIQNIPVRTELGRQVKEAFRPEPGVLPKVDYAALERRVLESLSKERGRKPLA